MATVRSLSRIGLGTAVLAAISACAYHGGPNQSIDNPVVRKVSWFSYLDGGDIRETCTEGAPERYRLVYNGQYYDQTRSYEINGGLPNGAANMTARARGKSNLMKLRLENPWGPWEAERTNIVLSPAEFATFRTLLTQSGFGTGAPQGLRLHSQDFYWVAAGCVGGKFEYFAWLAKKGRFENVKFQDFLLHHDQTGLAFRQPVPVYPIDKEPHQSGNNDNYVGYFTLTVSGEGLGGLANAF
jgi:hypothetical protein